MKRLILIIFLTISCIGAKAQDKIINVEGDTINCKMSDITNDRIEFLKEGEDATNSISKDKVQEIIFESGLVQYFSNRSEIKDEKDWEKVQITSVESDMMGLVKGEELMAGKHSAFTLASNKKQELKAIQKLKKQAAINGYPIVLLINKSKQGVASKIIIGTYSNLKAIGYKYE